MLPLSQAQVKKLYLDAMKLAQSGRKDEALAKFLRVVAAQPSLAEAHFQIGRLHASNGALESAEAALRTAQKLLPKEPAIWTALAQVLQGPKLKKLQREAKAAGVNLGSEPDISAILAKINGGKAGLAEKEAMALVMKVPNAGTPALALGLARTAQKNWTGAIGPLEKAVERGAVSAAGLVALADASVQTGRWMQAEEAIGKAEAANAKKDALAEIKAGFFANTCRPEAALDALQKAGGTGRTQLIALGNAYAALRRSNEAWATYAKLPGRPDRLLRLADKLSSAGEAETAEAVLDHIIACDAKSTAALTLRGQQRQSAGDLQGAEADLMSAIQQSGDAAQAIRAYIGARKISVDDPIIPILRRRIHDIGLPKASRRVLYFSAAKLAEDLGETQDVFPNLERANRLMRQEFPYDFQSDLDHARTLISAYPEVASIAQPGDEAAAPIFVSGPPRSGTTLVETILAAHPRVTAGGEMPFLVQALNLPISKAMGGKAGDWATAGCDYIKAARRRTGAEDILTDKAISTFSRIGYAAIALPQAKFIMLRRDPRDVGLSIYRNMFPDGVQVFSTDLTDIGRYLKLYDAFLAYWVEALPERVHVVDYEALTAEPEPNIRALVAFAGLDWNEACLSPQSARRRVDTLSFAQVRQPIYRGSVAGWRRYENELAPLLEALEKPVTL